MNTMLEQTEIESSTAGTYIALTAAGLVIATALSLTALAITNTFGG